MVPGKCERTADTNRALGYQPSLWPLAWRLRDLIDTGRPVKLRRPRCRFGAECDCLWEVHKRDGTWQRQSSCRANALCGTSPGLIFWEIELLGLWLLLSPSLSLLLLFLVLITDLAPAVWGGNKLFSIHTPAGSWETALVPACLARCQSLGRSTCASEDRPSGWSVEA